MVFVSFPKRRGQYTSYSKPNVVFPSTAYNPAKNTVMRSFATISVAWCGVVSCSGSSLAKQRARESMWRKAVSLWDTTFIQINKAYLQIVQGMIGLTPLTSYFSKVYAMDRNGQETVLVIPTLPKHFPKSFNRWPDRTRFCGERETGESSTSEVPSTSLL